MPQNSNLTRGCCAAADADWSRRVSLSCGGWARQSCCQGCQKKSEHHIVQSVGATYWLARRATMEWLWIAVATCVLVPHSVKGKCWNKQSTRGPAFIVTGKLGPFSRCASHYRQIRFQIKSRIKMDVKTAGLFLWCQSICWFHTLEWTLLPKVTTGGGSMRRGYDTTARRPSTRYCLILLSSLNTTKCYF